MAEVKRIDWDVDDGASPPRAETGHQVGGTVAEIQADLARRLTIQQIASASSAPVPTGERIVRTLSSIGGYAALAAGYVVVALAIARLL